VILGINKVECMDRFIADTPPQDRQAAIEYGTAFESPIYIYRRAISSTNVIGAIRPYEGDLSASANYGLVGGNANLQFGPELETGVMKVFFYNGTDGLTFYLIQNKKNGTFTNESRIFVSSSNNSAPLSVVVSDEPGDLIESSSNSIKRVLDLPLDATLFDGLFNYVDQTAGGVIGVFDDLTEIRDWEVNLDAVDTGQLTMLKAADGHDDSEIVLAQGPLKVDYDFSNEREPIEEGETPDPRTAWGGLTGLTSGNWYYKFVGDDPSSRLNPYSLFDGTYAGPASFDIGIGNVFTIYNSVKDQNIRLWRDYKAESSDVALVPAAGLGEWIKPPQTNVNMLLYTANSEAKNIYAKNNPISVSDLRVLATSLTHPAVTFSLTLVDEDGNAFEFPERTIYKQGTTADENQAVQWISFGTPIEPEVVIVESDPTTLESPPDGPIIGTEVTGDFKFDLDLRKLSRLIIDIKHCEEGGGRPIIGIHTIAAMTNFKRFPTGGSNDQKEPFAYVIIESFARYWRYEVPADGWPDPYIPDNWIGFNIAQWWPPLAVNDVWSIIQGFDGESIRSGAGPRISDLEKDPTEEIKNNRIIFTTIPPSDGCQMHWKQVDWLERGHRIGAACSFFITVDGMSFIVSKRSIGVDTTCGGGESADNPCVQTFVEAGVGHPAIAWPSIDGDEFIGKPTSGFITFVKDDALSDRILEEFAKGNATQISGDPQLNIPFVLFPSL
jgi:hypothetical protein